MGSFCKVQVLRMEWEVPEYYSVVNFLSRSTFGVFCSANCDKTKRKVTIKAIGTSNKEIAKIAYRELKTLKFVEHKNIIKLVDMFYRERLYLVSEMMDDNLNDLIRTKRFEEEKVKSLTYQIINGLDYLHSIGIIHMNLKPSSISINKNYVLKITDLNLERLKQEEDIKWYKAPEIIYTWKSLNSNVDMWSVGCILAEFLSGRIAFAGRDHLQQLRLIVELLGTPEKAFFEPSCHYCIITQNLERGEKFIKTLPYYKAKNFDRYFEETTDEQVIKLLHKLLVFDPKHRTTSHDALKDPYFNEIHHIEESKEIAKFDDAFESSELDWIKLINEEISLL